MYFTAGLGDLCHYYMYLVIELKEW